MLEQPGVREFPRVSMCADGEGAYFMQGSVKTGDLGGGEISGICFWMNGGMVENLVALKRGSISY